MDKSGNIYLSAYTLGALSGNTFSGGSYTGDAAILKYDSNGVRQWTQLLGSSSNEVGHSVSLDSHGNVYVSGYTQGGLDGNSNAGGDDIFIVKYTSGGVKQWTQQYGTSANESGNYLTIDGSDNIYVTGYTNGGLNGNTNLGNADIFLMKLK